MTILLYLQSGLVHGDKAGSLEDVLDNSHNFTIKHLNSGKQYHLNMHITVPLTKVAQLGNEINEEKRNFNRR